MKIINLSSLIVVLLLLVMSRFALGPVLDYAIDDWGLVTYGENNSIKDVVKKSMLDPYRPLILTAQRVFANFVGDNLHVYAAFRFLFSVIFVLAVTFSAYVFTASIAQALLAASLISIIPVVHETFGYSVMSINLLLSAVGTISVAFWELYLDKRKIIYFAGSICTYVIIAPSEVGLLISVYFITRCLFTCRKLSVIAPACVYVLVGIIYAGWRFTGAFGYGAPAHLSGKYFNSWSLSIVDFFRNIRTMFSWFVGGNHLDLFIDGLTSFRLFLPKYQTPLLLGISLLVGLLVWMIYRMKSGEQAQAMGKDRIAAILLMMALTYAPFLLFSAQSRHTLGPAPGLAILLSHFIVRYASRSTYVFIALFMVFSTIASAGLNRNWRYAGIYHRNIYNYMVETRDEWMQKKYIIFDTELRRQRITKGLHTPATTYLFYGGAYMPHGGTLNDMVIMAGGGVPTPSIILDAETGARWEGDWLHAHARFDPGKPYSVHKDDVFVISCFDVGSDSRIHGR